TGVFGESFVMDIPDLPLVLQLLAAADSNCPYQIAIDDLIEARHPRGQLRQWPIRTAPRSRTSSTRGPGAASNERACIDEAFAPEAGKAAPVRYCHSRGQFQLLRLSCSSSIRPSAPGNLFCKEGADYGSDQTQNTENGRGGDSDGGSAGRVWTADW